MMKNKIPKINKNLINTAGLMQRWLLCQRIGKCYYHSQLPFQKLEQVHEFLSRSDVLEKELPIIDIK